MSTTYAHQASKLSFKLSINNRVSISRKDHDRSNYLLRICLLAHDLAKLIGIKVDYSSECSHFEPLTADLTLLSACTGYNIKLLKGWKYFQSCVKGFNSLGLIAEQILPIFDNYAKMTDLFEKDLSEFLENRIIYSDILNNNSDIAEYARKLSAHSSDACDKLCLSIWKTFSSRPIICSTSSNMGISLHECLRAFQAKPITFKGITYSLLRPDEGKLVIWCPDREADFMNDEKADMLESLVAEPTKTTKLRTYINRQQRDPGALSDALSLGGYFFPTNPQSPEEVQNLLFVGLKELALQNSCHINELLTKKSVHLLLHSLDAEIVDNTIIVTKGVEGGIAGLMLPYLIMIEEHLRSNQRIKSRIPCTWNQASIGAALAATVIADNILRGYSTIINSNQELLNKEFFYIRNNPKLVKNICKQSRIHGLFDLANIQSLAQLLGVVVLRHTSGRGTAFVGLGSSSYSNGNLCFEILNESSRKVLAFQGKDNFHPATHTMNYVAQAIIYGEGQWLVAKGINFNNNEYDKPEPAGAAALAGFLLLLLDNELLSIFEIALLLKQLGFSESTFLRFCNFTANVEGKSSFIQLAFEEGPCMGNFCSNLLDILSCETELIKNEFQIEASISYRNQRKSKRYARLGLSDKFINYIYSTGNNTQQPSSELTQELRMHSLYLGEISTYAKPNYWMRIKNKIFTFFS